MPSPADDATVVADVRVPRAVVANPGDFGGASEGDCLRGDLLLSDGRARRLLGAGETAGAGRLIDAGGAIVLPALTEVHCHLDKCHTISRLGPVGGGLADAGERMRRDKSRWSHADVRSRAARGLDELETSGCRVVRTHVDWSPSATPPGETPVAWHALGELAEERRSRLTLQRCPLLPLEALDGDYASHVAGHCARAEGVIGLFVLGQDHLERRLTRAFEIAERFELALDFHVDEDLDATGDGLLAIARLALARRFERPVLCGHACALASLEADTAKRIVDAVARAGIVVAVLPATNLYLQDRGRGMPVRRGLTRVHDLVAAGASVTFGCDNVGDAYCPIGEHDPMATLRLAALAAHLDPPYGRWLPAVTTEARPALGLDPMPVDGAPSSELVVSAALHSADLLRLPRRPLGELFDRSPREPTARDRWPVSGATPR